MRIPSFVTHLVTPSRRSYWRGFVAGLFSHYLALAALLVIVYFFRPIVWAAVYDTPYTAPLGPVDPMSTEGTLLQVVGLLSWVPGGIAAMHWSATRRPWSALALVALSFALLALGAVQGLMPAMSTGRAIWYCLSSTLGIAAGAVAYSLSLRQIVQRAAKSSTPSSAAQ